jgi:Fe2+ transport system protein FeoA
MTLDAIPKDAIALVTSVEPGDQSLRLMEMGIVPGARVRLVKSAPLGDPIQICVRDYHLALRRSEARSIQVKLSPEVPLS